jgi:hypothetical protein
MRASIIINHMEDHNRIRTSVYDRMCGEFSANVSYCFLTNLIKQNVVILTAVTYTHSLIQACAPAAGLQNPSISISQSSVFHIHFYTQQVAYLPCWPSLQHLKTPFPRAYTQTHTGKHTCCGLTGLPWLNCCGGKPFPVAIAKQILLGKSFEDARTNVEVGDGSSGFPLPSPGLRLKASTLLALSCWLSKEVLAMRCSCFAMSVHLCTAYHSSEATLLPDPCHNLCTVVSIHCYHIFNKSVPICLIDQTCRNNFNWKPLSLSDQITVTAKYKTRHIYWCLLIRLRTKKGLKGEKTIQQRSGLASLWSLMLLPVLWLMPLRSLRTRMCVY